MWQLPLGRGGVVLYLVVSALLCFTLTHIPYTHACLMSAKEPGAGWGCCKINFLMRKTDHNSCETKHLGRSGDRWGEKCMKFSHILVLWSSVFLLTSLSQKFSLFLRGFALIVADRQQCFPVEDSVSNVECAYRHNVLLWQWCVYPVFRCCICL